MNEWQDATVNQLACHYHWEREHKGRRRVNRRAHHSGSKTLIVRYPGANGSFRQGKCCSSECKVSNVVDAADGNVEQQPHIH
jgi:hypothetical protein